MGSGLGTNDTLFRVVSETNLTVTKSAVVTPITAGGNAQFLITVKNNGSDTLSNVGISDALPPDLTWSESANECSIVSQLLTCSISLAKGASYSVTVSAQANEGGSRDEPRCHGQRPTMRSTTPAPQW